MFDDDIASWEDEAEVGGVRGVESRGVCFLLFGHRPPVTFRCSDGVKVGVGLASGNGTAFGTVFPSKTELFFQANHSNDNDSFNERSIDGFGSFLGCCLLLVSSLSVSLLVLFGIGRYRQRLRCKSDEGIQNKEALKAELTHTELGESGSAEIVCVEVRKARSEWRRKWMETTVGTFCCCEVVPA